MTTITYHIILSNTTFYRNSSINTERLTALLNPWLNLNRIVLTLNVFFSAVTGATPAGAVAEGKDRVLALILTPVLAPGVSGTAFAFLLGAAVFYRCQKESKTSILRSHTWKQSSHNCPSWKTKPITRSNTYREESFHHATESLARAPSTRCDAIL